MIEPPDPVTARALARLYDLDLSEDPGDLDLYLALADRAEGPILEARSADLCLLEARSADPSVL